MADCGNPFLFSLLKLLGFSHCTLVKVWHTNRAVREEGSDPHDFHIGNEFHTYRQ